MEIVAGLLILVIMGWCLSRWSESWDNATKLVASGAPFDFTVLLVWIMFIGLAVGVAVLLLAHGTGLWSVFMGR